VTEHWIKISWRILIIGLSIFVWLRPLFYAYHEPFIFDFIQFILLGFCILSLLTISIKLKPIKINGFIIIALIMMSYPLFHKALSSESENIFFKFREKEMKQIVNDIKTQPSLINSEILEKRLKRINIQGIDTGKNYIAFGVNIFLDNADGFIYIENGEFPVSVFEGHLIYKDSLKNKWFTFSSR